MSLGVTVVVRNRWSQKWGQTQGALKGVFIDPGLILLAGREAEHERRTEGSQGGAGGDSRLTREAGSGSPGCEGWQRCGEAGWRVVVNTRRLSKYIDSRDTERNQVPLELAAMIWSCAEGRSRYESRCQSHSQLRRAPLKQNAQKNGPSQSPIIALGSFLNDHDFTDGGPNGPNPSSSDLQWMGNQFLLPGV